MALSAATCYQLIDHTLGDTPASEVERHLILNQAMRTLVSAHPWNWCVRTTTLGLTDSQSYIDLPSDFVQLVAYGSYAGATLSLRMTTYQEIVDLRSSSASVNGFGYAAAIAYSSAGGSGGAPTPRLEIYPTPSDDTASAFTIFYRAELPAITSDQEFVSIPSWLELPFIQLLRAIARGYEEEDEESMQARIARVRMSAEWADALRRDGMVQPDLGIQRGGAVEEMYGVMDDFPPHTSPLTIPS